MADHLRLERLLWPPLPDPLPPPSSCRFRRLRHLLATATTRIAAARLPLQDLVDRRVRRGAVQALVREAYLAALAEQDEARRRPAAFATAWKTHLDALIACPNDELAGWWGEHTITAVDVELAWALYAAADHARQRTIERASARPSRPIAAVSPPTTAFAFAIVGDAGGELGDVKYGVCSACRIGLLYNIGFAPDWQFSGLGRLALRQLEARHPDLTWYTSGQHTWAKGFYDRYRQTSASPWTPKQHPCPHFR